MIHSFTEAFLSFSAAVSLHILLCRFTSQKQFVLRHLVFGLFIFFVLLLYQIKYRKIDFVSLYIFTSLWMIYLIFLVNLMNSVTLKMLEYISNSSSMKVHQRELDSQFSKEDFMTSRITAMENNNFISCSGDIVKLKTKGVILALMIIFIRKIFSITEVG